MKRHLPCLLATIAAVALGRVGLGDEATRPNILLIYTDDHGWADLGAQGVDKDIRTPNLDQLARDGVVFKRGYVTAPQCTPSRAGVLTGVYQQRFGVEHNGIPMRSEVITLPERLGPAGYTSGISGKWHLDVEQQRDGGRKNRLVADLLPHKQGFDEYFTGSMQDYVASHALDGARLPGAPQRVRAQGCRVVIQTQGALAFLDRRAARPDQPWFLYLAYMAPHVPLEAAEPWFSRTPAHLPKERRQALSLIGAIDDGVGRVRAKLKAMGQEQNTLLFFIGDNGAPLGAAWDGSLNLPMKGQKGMLSEGGIRVPFMAAWPGKIPGGQVYEHPVISLDVAATAVALAGGPPRSPEGSTGRVAGATPAGPFTAVPPLDGVNLMPYLTGDSRGAPHATLYWRWMSQAAILEFPYKLIALGDRQRLLFDITTPEGENLDRNLIRKHPAIAMRLEAKLKAWCDTLQPPGLPTSFDRHHEGLFAEHGIIAATTATKTAPEGTIQGWLCRNGKLAVKDRALVITPDAKTPRARPFLTHSGLDLPGPVTVTLRLRAARGGPSTLTWRTRQQPDFLAENTVRFDWPASSDWQQVKAELPVAGRLIHLRITPAQGSAGLAMQSVELRPRSGTAQSWRFDNGP